MVDDCKNVSDGIPHYYTSHNDRSHRMFRNGNYEQASNAFRRAGRDREAGICDAYDLQEKASLTSTTASETRIQAFVKAAKAFLGCAWSSPARQVKERLTCYEAAGDCYKEAHDLKRAADNYQLAGKYDKAALTYQDRGCIDEMMEVITRHKNSLNDTLHEQLMTDAKVHYFEVYFNGSSVSERL